MLNINLHCNIQGFRDYEELIYFLKKRKITFKLNENPAILKTIRSHNKNYKYIFTQSLKLALLSLIMRVIGADVCLDIRSVSLSKKPIYRLFVHSVYRFVSKYVKTFVISKDVALEIGIKRFELKPMGGRNHEQQSNDFFIDGKYNFVYCGAFEGRELLDGIKLLSNQYNSDHPIHFHFFGNCSEEEKLKIGTFLSNNCFTFNFYGWVKSDLLFKKLNSKFFGFSYVPNNKLYKHQFPGKIYDYIGQGMPVILNKTSCLRGYECDERLYFLEQKSGDESNGLIAFLNHSHNISLKENEHWDNLNKRFMDKLNYD